MMERVVKLINNWGRTYKKSRNDPKAEEEGHNVEEDGEDDDEDEKEEDVEDDDEDDEKDENEEEKGEDGFIISPRPSIQ